MTPQKIVNLFRNYVLFVNDNKEYTIQEKLTILGSINDYLDIVAPISEKVK